MPSLKESAIKYEPQTTKNVAELKEVSVDIVVFEGKGKDQAGEEFTYNYIEVEGEQYRVPNKVLSDLKAILEKKPDLQKFAVSKSGSGMGTKYTVIPL
jgi:hypothetical protein